MQKEESFGKGKEAVVCLTNQHSKILNNIGDQKQELAINT